MAESDSAVSTHWATTSDEDSTHSDQDTNKESGHSSRLLQEIDKYTYNGI